MNLTSYLTAFNVFLIWLSFASVCMLAYTFIKLNKANKKLDKLNTEQQTRWHELDMQAQKSYQEIIESANKRAAEITNKATEINNESSAKLQQTIDSLLSTQKQILESTSATVLKTHQDQMNAVSKHILDISGNTYKDIEVSSKHEIQAFLEIMKKQTFDVEANAQLKIKEEYEKLEKDLALKREEKMKMLEINIYKILTNVSKDIIGRSLDMSAQQELILRSLTQAKKEGNI